MLPGASVIREFERLLAIHCQKDYVISTCNASVGILGAFWSMGLSNKEIIVTSLTWPGALAGLLALNCKLKFCPVEPEFLTIDTDEISKLINSETKAVFSADFLGNPCQLDKVKKVCEEYDLLLIHDAASSFGSYFKGYQSGYYADISIYSFGSKKLFSLGEGGAIVTHNEQIYEQLLYGVTHPDRQQVEYDICNPFSLNISMNVLAAEYGLKTYDKQIKFIKERAEKITGYLYEISQLSGYENRQPNYYKVLIRPYEILKLPSNSEEFLSELPFTSFDTVSLPDVRDLTRDYRILDSSFFGE